MATPAAVPAGRPTLQIRGTAYPVLLPTLRDPRLHLAAVIISLQVLGQIGVRLPTSRSRRSSSRSLTCAVLEVGIAFRRQHVIMWPASALLTGNGVAFVLRVPGTQHGDWWSMHGWWIFAGTAAVSLLSKYVIKWRGQPRLQPVELRARALLPRPRRRTAPSRSTSGGGRCRRGWRWRSRSSSSAGSRSCSRLQLLGIAVGFWLDVRRGHRRARRERPRDDRALAPRARSPGGYFWWVLVTSPEVLVFLFFMITDPKTTPKGRAGRRRLRASASACSRRS